MWPKWSEGTWVAIIVAFLGGFGTTVLKEWFLRGRKKQDEATDIRKELHVEVLKLRNELEAMAKRHRLELDRLDAKLDEWREKYYTLLDEYTQVKGQNETMKGQYEEVLRDLESLRQLLKEKGGTENG